MLDRRENHGYFLNYGINWLMVCVKILPWKCLKVDQLTYLVLASHVYIYIYIHIYIWKNSQHCLKPTRKLSKNFHNVKETKSDKL